MSVVLTPSGTRGVKLPVPNGVIAAMTRILVGLQRLTRGRFKMNGQPLLLLRTVGAKSGEPRTTMLAQFPEPDGSTLIVASFGGTARHPAWYFNLAKHPNQVSIERGGELIRVRPQSLSGEEREQAWQRIVTTAPGFGEYQRKTDREIPVVRLTPIS
ncbi:MAG TPA: nitroreductase family deazaflavin-dependent oxidoreductase [Chloroflexota bacterium]|jgi:deazaflavin-dependent oxidoreductase (nitroreductase family)|nr:nitroreductase family deazaflavin-dependent oxidoreductase [Chloroflexota bacterium]